LKKKILITGINGFLGSHLAKTLKYSYEVIGLEYSLDNLFRIESENFKVYSSLKSNLETIFLENDFYAIIHAATVYRKQLEPLGNLIKTNILLPVNLLDLAIKSGVSLFLNTDSFFNNPSYTYSYLSDYTLSKKQSLEWIKLLSASSSCKVVNMKIFHMYGKEDAPNKFIPNILEIINSNTPFLKMTSGEQTRDFIYIKDVVSAYNSVLCSFKQLKKYQEFEIGSGQSYSIKNTTKLIKKITQSKTVLKFGELPYREGEIMVSMVSNFDLKKLGWKPNFSLKNGLKDYILK
tara:strand:+ start:4578 stop:5450 length:873 start_codon:yes stop_codon:yes gene_type:complete